MKPFKILILALSLHLFTCQDPPVNFKDIIPPLPPLPSVLSPKPEALLEFPKRTPPISEEPFNKDRPLAGMFAVLKSATKALHYFDSDTNVVAEGVHFLNEQLDAGKIKNQRLRATNMLLMEPPGAEERFMNFATFKKPMGEKKSVVVDNDAIVAGPMNEVWAEIVNEKMLTPMKTNLAMTATSPVTVNNLPKVENKKDIKENDVKAVPVVNTVEKIVEKPVEKNVQVKDNVNQKVGLERREVEFNPLKAMLTGLFIISVLYVSIKMLMKAPKMEKGEMSIYEKLPKSFPRPYFIPMR